jgi:hypothetical protein
MLTLASTFVVALSTIETSSAVPVTLTAVTSPSVSISTSPVVAWALIVSTPVIDDGCVSTVTPSPERTSRISMLEIVAAGSSTTLAS